MISFAFVATLYAAYDVDYFKFTTTQTSKIKVSIPATPPGVYTYVDIYSTNNQNPDVGGDGQNGGQALITITSTVPAGVHYVRVRASGSQNSPTPYNITITQQ